MRYYYFKQSLLLMIMLFAFSLTVNAKKKPKPIFKCILEVAPPSKRGQKITFSCWPSQSLGYYLGSFEVKNGTDERIFIEWENARLNWSRIVFGEDNRISIRNPKADEAISPHSTSISRNITGEKNYNDGYQIPLYNVRELKKKRLGSKDRTHITIPIRYLDGSVEEYKIVFSAWFELPPSTE